MKDRNYKVNIKDIYVGDVCGIDPSKIKFAKDGVYACFVEPEEKGFRLWYINRPHYWKQKDQLNYFVDAWHKNVSFNRSMLFVLDEEGHANDLLYDSPHYPVLNLSKNEDCLNQKICICMQTYKLYELLKHWGFSDEIGYEEVLKIRNTFFSCDYILDNCEYYGVIETDPRETGRETTDSKGNYRAFNMDKEDSVMPPCFFQMMWDHRDFRTTDKFKPCEEEGIVKSLGTMKKTK